jgi:hypothetical protein
MSVDKILEQQGWELMERQGWIAVQDHRPEFRAAFTTNRVGKIIDTSFYVTLQLPEVTKGLIRQLGRHPVSIKSTNGARDATYWGFDAKEVSEEDLKAFARRLAEAINDLI